MAMFHTNVLDNQIKALPTIATASGSVANFTTDMQENLVEVECEIVYSQASGTPSPSNPLPITTYTSLNLSHSGADTSNPNVTNIPFGQTVAKGTLNVTTGVLTVTHGYVDLGSLNWTSRGNSIFSSSQIPDSPRETTPFEILCDSFDVQNVNNAGLLLFDEVISSYPSYNRGIVMIRWTAHSSDTPSDFETAVTGMKLLYEYATPIEIQLDSTQIQALLNENNIWCDTNGDTSVKYILSVGKKIS